MDQTKKFNIIKQWKQTEPESQGEDEDDYTLSTANFIQLIDMVIKELEREEKTDGI